MDVAFQQGQFLSTSGGGYPSGATPFQPQDTPIAFSSTAWKSGAQPDSAPGIWPLAHPVDISYSGFPPPPHVLDPCSTTALPLHAPIPLPGSCPIPPWQGIEHVAPKPEFPQSPSSSSSSSNYHDGVPSTPSDSSPHDGFSPSYQDAFHGPISVVADTFPTPSELLSELNVVNGTGTPESDYSGDGVQKTFQRHPHDLSLSAGFNFALPIQDPISSHEKKRQLLECLEQYVVYLHEQLNLLGAQPAPLERVSTYKGLSSRSVRTLLLHMENTNKKLNLKIMAEEQRFVRLIKRREALLQREPIRLAHGVDESFSPHSHRGIHH
ncbi:hypothetical protein VNI00_001533 [Paramarasmius palmivorus]|uniref:BHLH domain-containing protein n=1 Tax=Paramarasmius palmivorus TaxID=297713 RepID=A0AAW0E4G8_9AGAR